jgi:hypothetical protein
LYQQYVLRQISIVIAAVWSVVTLNTSESASLGVFSIGKIEIIIKKIGNTEIPYPQPIV